MKKLLLTLFCLLLAGVMLFATACGDDKKDETGGQAGNDGSYYLYLGGTECDMDACLRIGGGKWLLVGQDLSGICRIENEKITLLYTIDESTEMGAYLIESRIGKHGELVELFSGTVGKGKIVLDRTLRFVDDEERIYYLNGRVTDGGSPAGAVSSQESAEQPPDASGYRRPTSLGTDLLSGIVEVDGKLYRLPCPVSVFISDGWTVEETHDAGVGSDEIIYVAMEKGSRELFLAVQAEDGGRIEDGDVFYVNVDDYDLIDVTLPGGITFGMTKAALENVIGTSCTLSDDGSVYEYFRSEGKIEIDVDVDAETNLVSHIDVFYDIWKN